MTAMANYGKQYKTVIATLIVRLAQVNEIAQQS